MTKESEGKRKRLSVKKQAVKAGGKGKRRKKGHLRRPRKLGDIHLPGKKGKNGHLHRRKKRH